jgi:hypothetical protein
MRGGFKLQDNEKTGVIVERLPVPAFFLRAGPQRPRRLLVLPCVVAAQAMLVLLGRATIPLLEAAAMCGRAQPAVNR